MAAAAGLAAVALGGAFYASSMHSWHAPMLLRDPPPPPPIIDRIPALVIMRRAGIGPEWLATIGLSPQGAATIRARVDQTAADHGADLQAADASLATARQALAALQKKQRIGVYVDPDTFAAAQSAVSAADASRQTLLLAVQAELLAQDLTAEQIAALSTVANNAHWQLPFQYLVVNRTEAQWVDLRDALDATRIAASRGTSPNQHAQGVVQTANSDPAVISALANLGNLAAIESAVGGP